MGTSHAAGWTSDSPTPRQLKELFEQIALKKITKVRAQAILRGSDGKWDTVPPPPMDRIRQEWEIFYDEYFDMAFNATDLIIPAHHPGYDRVLIFPSGLHADAVVEVCSQHFSIWCSYGEDLQEFLRTNERSSAQTMAYAIRVREYVEADEDMGNISAVEVAERAIPTMTLTERLVYELKYFRERGTHLDLDCATLCAGSRFGDGNVVPSVTYRHQDETVAIIGIDSGQRYQFNRARRVIA